MKRIAVLRKAAAIIFIASPPNYRTQVLVRVIISVQEGDQNRTEATNAWAARRKRNVKGFSGVTFGVTLCAQSRLSAAFRSTFLGFVLPIENAAKRSSFA